MFVDSFVGAVLRSGLLPNILTRSFARHALRRQRCPTRCVNRLADAVATLLF